MVWLDAGSLDVQGINCMALAKKLKIRHLKSVVLNLYFPHEDDCTVFYHCGPAGAFLMPCGVGTIFSLRNKDCRRPTEAKCVTLERFLEKKNVTLDEFYEEYDY